MPESNGKKPSSSNGRKRRRRKSHKTGIPERAVTAVLLVLTVLCLTDLPEILSQAVRFVAFAGYLYMGYTAVRNGKWGFTAVYLMAALVFQPFYMFGMGQRLLTVIDIVLIVVLLYSLYRTIKPKIKS